MYGVYNLSVCQLFLCVSDTIARLSYGRRAADPVEVFINPDPDEHFIKIKKYESGSRLMLMDPN